MLFVLSFFKSYAELRYYFGAEQATARVVRISERKDRERDQSDWHVTFEFRNEETNELQRGFSIVSDATAKQFSVRQKVPVEYYGDSILTSRLQGETNQGWVYLFLGSMTFTVGSVVVLSWQSVLEERRLRERKWWIR